MLSGVLLILVAITTVEAEDAFVAEFGTVPEKVNFSDWNGPPPSEAYMFHEQLNGDYHLHWNFNATHITFEVIVNATGWVGFGISPTGAMKSSDVVIGWVKDGQVHFADRFTEGRFLPAIDASQDWHLLMGQQVGQYTVLKMVRLLDTCDDRDLPITTGTTRVIFAYHSIDPPSDDAVMYHGINNRGTKSILFLDPPVYEQENVSLPSDTFTLEFKLNNYSVPSTDTTYLCSFWKLPPLTGKHHIFRYEPIISHEGLLHHALLWYCAGGIDEEKVNSTAFMCYTDRDPEANKCGSVFVSWAIGGKAFEFPSHVAWSVGSEGDPTYFMLEIHYDNVGLRNDLLDYSGMRVYMTSQLRQHDVGVILSGVRVTPLQMIPPYEPNFLSSGFCQGICIDEGLGDDEIYVIANMLHAHLIGIKLRTRHFREGRELPPILEDNSYDFAFQETRLLQRERTIKKGDSLVVECEYDSTKRTDVTYGGWSSLEEMCLSFLFYYPKNPKLSYCASSITYDVPAMYRESGTWLNESAHSIFKQLVDSASYTQLCMGPQGPLPSSFKTFKPAEITHPFTKPQRCQGSDGNMKPNSGSKLLGSQNLIWLFVTYCYFFFVRAL